MGNIKWWLGTLVGLSLLGSLGLSYVYDAVDGWVYSLLELMMMGIALFSMVISARNYLSRKSRFRNQMKKDLAGMSEILRNLEEQTKTVEPFPVANEEPLFMSLEEQFEYAKRLRNGKLNIKSDFLRGTYGIYNISSDDVMKVSNWLSEKKYSNSVGSLRQAGVVDDDLYQRLTAIDWGVTIAFEKYLSNEQFRGTSYLPPFTRIKEWQEEKDKFTYRILQGVYGEKEVVDSVKPLLRKGTVLENIRIEDQGTSSESDILYVGPTGLYTLEVKNIGAASKWNIKISKDGQWQKVFPDGNREAMKDVGGQLNHHIASQERFLNRKLKERYGQSAPYIEMKGAVVISNDSVIIDNDSDLMVRRKSSLNRYLEEGPEILSAVWQTRIIEIFEEFTLPGKRYEVPNFEAIVENILLDEAREAQYFAMRYSWTTQWLKNNGFAESVSMQLVKENEKWQKEALSNENEIPA